MFAAIALALAAAWRFTALKDLLTQENIREWAGIVRKTPWAPVVLVLAYTPAALIMFPRPILMLVAILAFGTWLGMAYAAAGVMVAALATYYAGLFIPKARVKRLAGDGFEPATRMLRRHGVVAMFVLNQVPVPPFAVQGIMAGAARINVWHYALGSLLGLAPMILAWTLFGREISATLEGSESINWWMVAGIVLVMAVLTVFVRRWFARETGKPASRR